MKNRPNASMPATKTASTHKRLIALAAVLVIAITLTITLTACNLSSILGLGGNDNQPDLYGPYYVSKVIDGDTIVVNIDGTLTKVRLIGVDAPESVHPDSEQNTPEGIAAANYLTDLIGGKYVYLEYDQELYDKYERTLAYVYLEDRQTMVEDLLLESGHAEVMIFPPNDKYESRFYKIARNR